jgi:hypothetical protein
MKSKQLQGVGVIKYIIAVVLMLLFVFNLLDQIQKDQDIIRRSYLTIPFLLISLSSLFIENKKYIAGAILICAVYSATDKMGETDFSIILFILSYAINKSKKYGIVVVVISLISVTIRFQLFDMTIYQYFLQVIAYISVFTLTYLIIFKQKTPKPVSDFDKRKIILYMQGKTPEEIKTELSWGVQDRTVRTFILDQVKDADCIVVRHYARVT